MNDERDAEFIANKQDFSYFLEPENKEADYPSKIEDMMKNGEKRLIVDLNKVNQQDSNMRRNILEHPLQYLPAWEDALKDFISHNQFDKVSEKAKVQKYRIGLTGGFGAHRVTPQELISTHVGQMVCVEGIVTKVSLVRPKIVESVHYCEETKEYIKQTYRDATNMVGLPTSTAFPTSDANGNPLTTEFGLCTFMDSQKIFIQDMPERTAAGSMPQTVECILEDDLVDACKPGDRVQMIGVYRALAGRVNGSTTGRFRTVLLVNNVRKMGLDDKGRQIDMDDVRKIKKLAKNKDIFNLLARSIAPTIHGHEYIKKAIVLQLLGGVEKNLDNGTHIRGDINILMVGDPSCGKSQLLRAVMNIAPLAINTTGRGSSGVGLTAAVTQDRESGERRLEAGAMVLADRGTVCIDEFDKMSDIDRTAIHEVMEQQTVTVAKAGIHTSLNARCSVIAAANPIYGQYDRRLEPHKNIGLPDSLLSRFDLLFIVLDKIDSEIDDSISNHVLSMHLSSHKDEPDSIFDDFEMYEDEDEETPVWEKNLPRIRHKRGRGRKREKYLSVAFCKKYIEFAKKQYKPKLTDEACQLIAETYADLRRAENTKTLPITARCLETLIRLSTAVSKLRLSKTIVQEDVEEAIKVLKFALTNDAEPEAQSRRRPKSADSDGEASEEEEEEAEQETENDSRRANRRRRRRVPEESEHSEDEKASETVEPPKRAARGRKRMRPDDETEDTQDTDVSMRDTPTSRRSKRKRPNLDQKSVQTVTSVLSNMFRKNRSEETTVDALMKELSDTGHAITDGELERVLEHLNNSNKIFKVGDSIHRI